MATNIIPVAFRRQPILRRASVIIPLPSVASASLSHSETAWYYAILKVRRRQAEYVVVSGLYSVHRIHIHGLWVHEHVVQYIFYTIRKL